MGESRRGTFEERRTAALIRQGLRAKTADREQAKRLRRHALRVLFIKRGYNTARRMAALSRIEHGLFIPPPLRVRDARGLFTRLL